MNRLSAVLLSVSLFGLPARVSAIQVQPAQTQPSPSNSSASITLPAGTRIELIVTRPVWALPAKDGDTVYAQTSFPTLAANGMAIPAGTFVQGMIEGLTRPTRKFDRAEIQVLFTKIVFANGYTVELPGGTSAMPAPAAVPTSGDPQPAQGETLIAVTVQVTMANDLLLDNGAEVEMTLGAPLQLDAKQIAQSIPVSRAPQPGQLKSATLCRDIPGSPGSPGTPDTVIPGTPSTTIPGGPGMPDITIPGTPDTVIPGIPGTPDDPGYTCPAKPLVVSCAPVNNQPTQSPQPVAAR